MNREVCVSTWYRQWWRDGEIKLEKHRKEREQQKERRKRQENKRQKNYKDETERQKDRQRDRDKHRDWYTESLFGMRMQTKTKMTNNKQIVRQINK